MQVESPSGQLTLPGDVGKTAISTSSSTIVASVTTGYRRGTTACLHLLRFFQVKVGAGIIRDIRARAPWYWSDWKDAWNYRVVPATALIFFAK
jgi:boron transporter